MLAHLLAACVGVTIALAGAIKLVNLDQWRQDARAQHLWPAVVHSLPIAELVIGALLIVLTPSAPMLGIATLLLLIFSAYLMAQIATKSQVPCACFGSRSRRPPSGRDVVRNVALMALLFISAALS